MYQPLCLRVSALNGFERFMIKVTVKLHGVFRIDRFKEKTLEYPPGTSVQDVVDQLQLPPHILGIILINDVHRQADDLLHDGDTLVLLPVLEGG